MAGTREGGKKAAETLLKKYLNFYRDMGKKGGKNGHRKGFAVMPHDKVVAAGEAGRRKRYNKKDVRFIQHRVRYEEHYDDVLDAYVLTPIIEDEEEE